MTPTAEAAGTTTHQGMSARVATAVAGGTTAPCDSRRAGNGAFASHRQIARRQVPRAPRGLSMRWLLRGNGHRHCDGQTPTVPQSSTTAVVPHLSAVLVDAGHSRSTMARRQGFGKGQQRSVRDGRACSTLRTSRHHKRPQAPTSVLASDRELPISAARAAQPHLRPAAVVGLVGWMPACVVIG